jgi:FtsH-binding integral membrane protein
LDSSRDAGLTAVAFLSRKDFSFVGGLLMWGGIFASVALMFWYVLRIFRSRD